MALTVQVVEKKKLKYILQLIFFSRCYYTENSINSLGINEGIFSHLNEKNNLSFIKRIIL